jgi:hypothetical protein
MCARTLSISDLRPPWLVPIDGLHQHSSSTAAAQATSSPNCTLAVDDTRLANLCCGSDANETLIAQVSSTSEAHIAQARPRDPGHDTATGPLDIPAHSPRLGPSSLSPRPVASHHSLTPSEAFARCSHSSSEPNEQVPSLLAGPPRTHLSFSPGPTPTNISVTTTLPQICCAHLDRRSQALSPCSSLFCSRRPRCSLLPTRTARRRTRPTMLFVSLASPHHVAQLTPPRQLAIPVQWQLHKSLQPDGRHLCLCRHPVQGLLVL